MTKARKLRTGDRSVFLPVNLRVVTHMELEAIAG